MGPRTLVASLLLAGLGCASSPDSSNWLDRQLAREAASLKPAQLESQDGAFVARPAARLSSPVSHEEDVYLAELDIGAESDAVCWIRGSEVNLATSVAAYANDVLSVVTDPNAIEIKRLAEYDAGAIGSATFMGANWMYQVDQEGEKAAGLLKVLSANARGGSVVCVHHEVGFRNTFWRFFSSLVSSLRFPTSQVPDPYYEEIFVVSIGDKRSGVQKLSFSLDQDGDTRVDHSSSIAFPRDLESLHTVDSEGIEFSTPEGILINKYEVEVESSEVTSELSLEPQDDGSWKVTGVFRSKPLDATIPSGSAVLSALGQGLEVRRAIQEQGTGAFASASIWAPSADPTRIVDATFEIGEALANREYRLKATIGPLAFEGIVDATGSARIMEMDLGAQRMRMERVFVDGEY